MQYGILLVKIISSVISTNIVLRQRRIAIRAVDNCGISELRLFQKPKFLQLDGKIMIELLAMRFGG